jgi:O-antigen ligase
VTERIPKTIFVAALVLGAMGLAYLVYSQPEYFTSKTYLGGLLLLEFLAAAVWMYRRVFFPLVITAFLLAGVDLPVGAFWTQARWLFLFVGASAGSVVMLRERRHHIGLFHILAMFAVLTTLVSATVSQYPSVALLKALSFVLLFLYAGTGARLAVTGRENRFFTGLLTGCELFVGALAVLYALGIEAMGNPNSLGAVMGVGAPILLWGTLLDEPPLVHRRRLVSYGICMYLTFHSHSRAGMAAALVSSGLLCLTLRKYKIVLKGASILLVLVAAGAILQPEALSNTVSSLKSSVIYKGSSEGGLLASRQSPWRAAVDSIGAHLWFGTGLGTAENPKGPRGPLGMFSSSSDVGTEHGSSYLSIVAWVGVIGALPFSLLLLLLLNRIYRTIAWLLKTGNACHPAVPLAMVMVAGMIHAGFEDWLFAPGYYLCVFFWSLAFVFVDVAPSPVPRVAFAQSFRAMQQDLGGIAPSRSAAARI